MTKNVTFCPRLNKHIVWSEVPVFGCCKTKFVEEIESHTKKQHWYISSNLYYFGGDKINMDN